MNLEINGVTWSIEGQKILHDVTVLCSAGELVGLVGPNGSGKTTLLRSVYRALRPAAGAITVGGDDVWRLPRRTAAQRTAVLLQERGAEGDFTVREMVLMGRTPHKHTLDGDTSEDLELVASSLARVGVGHLAERDLDTLSGGEKQRVLLARALAQEPQVLLLDEPTTHLDIRHQLDVLDLVRRLRVTTLAVLHDLNLAAAFCDRLCVLNGGQVVAVGTPRGVLTPDLIRSVYGVEADVSVDFHSQRPRIYFQSSSGDPHRQDPQ